MSSGPLDRLLRTGAYAFAVDDVHAAQAALAEMDGLETVTTQDGRVVVTAPDLGPEVITQRLVGAGIGVSGVSTGHRLEDVFLDLVDGDVEHAGC